MKKITFLLLFSLVFFSAPGEEKPFELSLFSPDIQLNSPSDDISGIRLGGIYSENRNVSGLDVNLIASRTRGDFKGFSVLSFYDRTEGDFTGVRIPWWFFVSYNHVGGNLKGLQFGGLNIVEGDFLGAQFGLLNINNGNSIGAQAGWVNLDHNFKGVRLGGLNMADSFVGGELGFANFNQSTRGVQIGLFNYTEHLQGVQIGLLNMAANSELFEILPIINFNLNF